jgi:hypothetical protein
VNGRVVEVVCRYQIGDTTPGPFEGSTTQDIDAALPQNTGESLAAASEVVVAETATPTQASPISDKGTVAGVSSTSVRATGTPSDGAAWDLIPEAAASDASRSDEVHPVAFSTTGPSPVPFRGRSSDESASQRAPLAARTSDIMLPPEQHESCPDPSSWSEFQQQARGTSGPPPRSGFLGIFRRDTSSAPAQPPTHSNVVSTLMGVLRSVRVRWRNVKEKVEGVFQANPR